MGLTAEMGEPSSKESEARNAERRDQHVGHTVEEGAWATTGKRDFGQVYDHLFFSLASAKPGPAILRMNISKGLLLVISPVWAV